MAPSLKSLLARAFLLSAVPGLESRATKKEYTESTVAAIKVLQDKWYSVPTGIYDDAWWNSGNALTTLADFGRVDVAAANQLNIGGIMRNTWANAQKTNVKTRKDVDHSTGVVRSADFFVVSERDDGTDDANATALAPRGFAKFINEFYDDEGWWALGLIRAWDISRDRDYLESAKTIFEDMKTGGNTRCGGGIYWNKERKYVNAISNELYLSVAAALANRVGDKAAADAYLNVARDQWKWFRNSGMINDKNLINDGLDDKCKNNGMQMWTYNQGVILGALTELARAVGRNPDGRDEAARLLEVAEKIALAAIKAKTNDKGVLVEGCEPNCGRDGAQFKGIFVRNLRYLHEARPHADYLTFILANADSILKNDRTGDGRMGVNWNGPADAGGPNGPSHSSALDVLVAAVAVA